MQDGLYLRFKQRRGLCARGFNHFGPQVSIEPRESPRGFRAVLQVDPAFQLTNHKRGMIQLAAPGFDIVSMNGRGCAAKIASQSVEKNDHQADGAGAGNRGSAI
jgi:hypothetical protein